MLCLFGDSHVLSFEHRPDCKSFWMEPNKKAVTMYRFTRYPINITDMYCITDKNYKIGRNSVVLFTYGFNDIQHKLTKHAKDKWKECVKTMVSTYIKYLKHMEKKYRIKPRVLCVFPCPLIDNSANGSIEVRTQQTRFMNALLEQETKKANIPFIDVYDRIVSVDDNGCERIKDTVTTDKIHLDIGLTPKLHDWIVEKSLN